MKVLTPALVLLGIQCVCFAQPSGPPPGFTPKTSVGPLVMIPPTHWPVHGGMPPCNGSVSADAFLKAIKPVFSVVPGASETIQWLNDNGWGTQRSQDYAECRPVCAQIPLGVQISEGNVSLSWNPQGPAISGEYGHSDWGRWGPGPGFHRVDPEIATASFSNGQLVCMNVRNWSDTHSILFQMTVVYADPPGR